MKQLILFVLIISCASCADTKKENETAKKTTIKCDSVEMIKVDSAGVETMTKVYRCDSNFVEEPAK